MIPAALVESTQITPLLYAQPFTSNGVDHPANALTLWTPAQLKKVGVYPLVHAQSPLPYHIPGTPTYALVGGEVIESRTDTPMQLADVRTQKLVEIDMELQAAVAPFLVGYSEIEQRSWAEQLAEAVALQAYPTATSTYLDGLAKLKGITAFELAAKVRANATTLKQSTTPALHHAQTRTKALFAATTFAEAINV